MDKKIQEIREANAVRKITIPAHPEYRVDAIRAHADISYLLQQIEIKDKALKWYAAIENYEIGNFTVDQNGELDEWESRVQQDAGEKARTALKGEDTP
ncbi:hypothetical protein ACU1JV_12680 [Paenibacillus sp. T2-29]